MDVAAALAPVFFLIVIGYAFRRSGFLEEGFWVRADRLTYFVLFPALLAHNLALAHLGEIRFAGMVVALVGAVAAVALVLLVLRPRLKLGGPAFTSVFQGSIRPNTYVGLAAAVALYGDAGLTLAAVAVAAMVPLVNVLSTTALARFASDGPEPRGDPPPFREIAATVARNPLILACLAGVVLNWSGLGLPLGSEPVLDILGRAALPLGLLSVGAGLDVKAARSAVSPLAVASVCKLVALPAIAVAALKGLGVGGLTATVAILFAALPTSATSYVMARQLGGDHGLMAGIITVETALAVVTLPAALILFG
ncbi:MAG: AEC family transporter [Alphaproteobacteria bacterium]